MSLCGQHVARDEGREIASLTLHAQRATRLSSIDELSERCARSCHDSREPPLKSESLQKDQRSVRYNRFDGGAGFVEQISPLSAGEARRSALRGEDRRASNSGLRGHCRADGGPIASTLRRARRPIGGTAGPRPAHPAARTLAGVRRPEPCGSPRPRSRESGTDGELLERSSGTKPLLVASHYQNIFGDGTRVNLNTKSSLRHERAAVACCGGCCRLTCCRLPWFPFSPV